jgi:putative methylase
MNKKILEIELSKLKDYTVKKPSLEQYTTPSTIAASLVWSAFMKGDVENKIVADFGCGNGVLGIGCLLLGAKKVVFIDVDERALDIAEENCIALGLSNYELVNKNVADVETKFDTIVMNPPFGVQTRGLDVLFLKQASILSKVFYTVYKADGLKIINRELPNKKSIVLEATELLLKNQFSFHTKSKEKTKIILVKIA